MKIKKIRRQGDVYIHEVEAMPQEIKDKMKPTNEITLALGEVTGHSHRVVTQEGILASMVQNSDRDTWMSIPEAGSTLIHEDHAHFDIPAGDHFSQIQEEYDPLLERRKVQD